MFRGRYEHNVDGKGRTSLPARFRDVLAGAGESKLVITTGLEPCLVAYPMSEWLAFEAKLSKLPQFDRSVAMLRRIYVSGAIDCELDKMGRVLIPAPLRAHADLGKKVVWAGMGSHIELWSKSQFDALRNDAVSDEDQRRAMAERLAELGL